MEQVLYRKKGHIAYISLNNPDSLNAINRKMTRELRDVWIDFRDDKDLWVAILTGEGRSFCAGADVKEMERGKWRFRQSLLFGDDRAAASNYDVYKPIVAAVHRHVVGAGLLLTLEADIRIASDDALFSVPEGKVNVPTLLAPYLVDHMPRALANELMYVGKPIDAQRAYDNGIVNRVVPREKLMETAVEFAEKICELGPLSLWATKEILLCSRNLDNAATVALIEHIATPVWNSRDSQEAKQAFMEKRKPNWTLE